MSDQEWHTNTKGWRFVRRYRVSNDDFGLYIARSKSDGFVRDGQQTGHLKLVFTPFDAKSSQFDTPAFLAGDDDDMAFLQAAMDLAWDIGIRPQNFHTREPEIAATNRHLNDMRAIVGGKLGVTLP